jgi:hypothetical protein
LFVVPQRPDPTTPLVVVVGGTRVYFDHYCRDRFGLGAVQAEGQRFALWVGDRDGADRLRGNSREIEIVDHRDDTTHRWIDLMEQVQFAAWSHGQQTSQVLRTNRPEPEEMFAYMQARGWTAEPCCATHDGIPSTPDEQKEQDEGFDPCQGIVRFWPEGYTPVHPPEPDQSDFEEVIWHDAEGLRCHRFVHKDDVAAVLIAQSETKAQETT